MYNKSFRIFSDAEEKAYPRPYSMIDSIQEIEPQKQ